MVIARSILLHSPPRGRPQLAFQFVVPELLEAGLLFAEPLGEVVGRCGQVGRLLPAPRLRRQPVLGKSVQDPEVPTRVPGTLRLDSGCTRLLPALLSLVQHRALSQRHRLARARTPLLRPADGVISQRQVVLSQAFERNPERFVRAHPRPPARLTSVWINPPPAQAPT